MAPATKRSPSETPTIANGAEDKLVTVAAIMDTIPIAVATPLPPTDLDMEDGKISLSSDRGRKQKEPASSSSLLVASLAVARLHLQRMGQNVQKDMLRLAHNACIHTHGFEQLVSLPWNTARYSEREMVEFIANFDRPLHRPG